MDQVFIFGIAVILGIAIPIVLILWFTQIKARFEKPLQNEKDWGVWNVFLPKLGLLNEGAVTEGMNYFQSAWSKAADNSTDKKEREAYINFRNLGVETCHIFAQKTDKGKFLYFFLGNPLDPKNHMSKTKPSRFGEGEEILFIHNIQDCKSGGAKDPDGFQYVGVSIGKETVPFSTEQDALITGLMDATKYAKVAALAKEKMKFLEERNQILDSSLDRALDQVNKKTSEAAESKIAAGVQPLVTVQAPEPKGFRLPGFKWFFSGWQAFCAMVAYIITPNVMTYFHIDLPEPGTVAIGIAVVVFFLYPVIRRLISK